MVPEAPSPHLWQVWRVESIGAGRAIANLPHDRPPRSALWLAAMRKGSSLWRDGMTEAVRALLVIALLCLSFGHRPAAAAALPGDASAYLINAAGLDAGLPVFCGDAPDHGEHAPCHACRLFAGLNLPPAPPVLAWLRPARPLRFAPASAAAPPSEPARLRPASRAPPMWS